MSRITMRELAVSLSLSTSTVSRALSDHPDISEVTKQRVREAARLLNYKRNMHARLFRKQQSSLIAVIVPEFNTFYTPNLINGINIALEKTKYSLITFTSNDSIEQEKEIIQRCVEWSVEGVLISLSKETNNLNHFKPLRDANINCVILDKSVENDHFSTLTIDNIKASYLSTAHLIDKGHKSILGIFADPALNISQERLAGHKKALNDANLPIIDENMLSVKDNKLLNKILPHVLTYNKSITAIFTMSDELLSLVLFNIQKLGLSIPNDISVISISDGIYPYMVHPQICHMLDSGEKMGIQAVQRLITDIESINNNIKEDEVAEIELVSLSSVSKLST